MEDRFSLAHRGMLAWLAGVTAGVIALVSTIGAASWLFNVGVVLVMVAVVAHALRTGEWQYFGKLPSPPTWFEGWAFCTGALIAAVSVLAEAAWHFAKP
jgi:hypothetical protein